MHAIGFLALALALAPGPASPQTGALPAADLAVIEKVIRDNIGWALTKDRSLLESTLAQDERLFIFNPTPEATVGWQEFIKGFDFWMDPRFKATRPRHPGAAHRPVPFGGRRLVVVLPGRPGRVGRPADRLEGHALDRCPRTA